MIARLFWVALAAGAAAGAFASLAQAVGTWPLIAEAELYEAGHADEAADTARALWSVAFNLLAGLGFALLANAGMLLARAYRPVALDWRAGAILGLAGFVAFAFAPAMGIAPALPGMAEGELAARQAWWIATAAATLGGIAALAGAARARWRIAGVVVLALPHLIGAPEGTLGLVDLFARAEPVTEMGLPADVARGFALASLAAAAAFWAALGLASSWLQRRLLPI
ncbi:MAG: CbtA family protein [Azospirillum sp.]|nr:CbtA family protein [Azospirillum sp.]MCZ8122006.1 CbtA family protein [Magnetospirillum sp.]